MSELYLGRANETTKPPFNFTFFVTIKPVLVRLYDSKSKKSNEKFINK
jgi:hypothetical protein